MIATLITANTNAPPHEAGLGAKSEAEPETDWTTKNGNDIIGYTAYLGVDEGSRFVRRAVLTSAQIYESVVANGSSAATNARSIGSPL